DEHHGGNQGRATGAEEAGRGQEPAPHLAETGGQGEEHARPEAEAREEPAGAGQAIAAEPPEELRAIRTGPSLRSGGQTTLPPPTSPRRGASCETSDPTGCSGRWQRSWPSSLSAPPRPWPGAPAIGRRRSSRSTRPPISPTGTPSG